MDCNNCLCQECKSYEECEPCRGDWDYEHPCPGYCDDFEPKSESEKENDSRHKGMSYKEIF